MGLSAEANQRLTVADMRKAADGLRAKSDFSGWLEDLVTKLRALPADKKAALVGQLQKVLKDMA